MNSIRRRRFSQNALIVGLVLSTSSMIPAFAQTTKVKGQNIKSLLSSGGGALYTARHRQAIVGGVHPFAALVPDPGDGVIPPSQLGLDPSLDYSGSGGGSDHNGGLKNVFVNDPCSDPPPNAPFPSNYFGTVQSETEMAVLNRVRGEGDDNEESGRLMVAGYNDSLGFYDNREGLSGFSYSTNGGKSWIDGGGLPPVGLQDQYFGDPVVVVHHRSKTFYYASIYQAAQGFTSISVNRGHFMVAPPQGRESKANTRCAKDPGKTGIPDPPAMIRERIIWEPPVVAVAPPFLGPNSQTQNDFLDKEWLFVDQKTGFLYLSYVRFCGGDGSCGTPIELVRSFDGGHTWTPPTVIVPNLDDTFNTATQPVVTPSGRVIVSWLASTFLLKPPFPELNERVETAISNDGGNTFGPPVRVAYVNPQGEPKGYNRGRSQILNVPYITVHQGVGDGAEENDENEGHHSGRGNVYITYFDGKTALPQVTKAADIKLSVSHDDGSTYAPPVKVNDDDTNTSHVFSSVQVNKEGTVFVTWIDRRVDPANNVLNDTWAAFSENKGKHFGENVRVSNVSTDWFARADARPNFGDYNSSEVIDFENFASIWSDARFPTGTFFLFGKNREAATPDVLFAIVGNGKGRGKGRGGDDSSEEGKD